MAASNNLTNVWLAQDARIEEIEKVCIGEILMLTQKAKESLRILNAATTPLFEDAVQFYTKPPFPASYVRALSGIFDATPTTSLPTPAAPTTSQPTPAGSTPTAPTTSGASTSAPTTSRSTSAAPTTSGASASAPTTSRSTPSGPLRAVRQRTSFSVGQGAIVLDVKLLSDDLVVVADGSICSLMLFTTQGQRLHSLGLGGPPARLAVINPAATDRWRVAVSMGFRKKIVIVEVSRGGMREVDSFETQDQCRAITAPDANTLAVGYHGKPAIDLYNMSGSVLRRLNGALWPLYMAAAGDGRHIVMTTRDDTIAKVAVADGTVSFSSKVDRVKNLCGISLLAGGACVVSDAVNRSLHCVTPDGRWGGELWRHPGGGDIRDTLGSVSVCGSVCVVGTVRGTLFVLDV